MKIKDTTKSAVDDKERNDLLKINSTIQEAYQNINSNLDLTKLRIADIDSRINEVDEHIVEVAN